MSTIFYEDEKFLKIGQTMKINSIQWAWEFAYPDYWDDPEEMDKIIQRFIQDLRNTNIKAVNVRYNENHPFSILPKKYIDPYKNDFELLRSLQSIEYNIDTESVNNSAKILHKIIHSLLDKIVRELPEYQLTEHIW